MKTLFAFVFFSMLLICSSANAGLFGPSNEKECIQKYMPKTNTKAASVRVNVSCRELFSGDKHKAKVANCTLKLKSLYEAGTDLAFHRLYALSDCAEMQKRFKTSQTNKIQEIRKQYPDAYNDMDDKTLADAIYDKFYENKMEKQDYINQMGIQHLYRETPSSILQSIKNRIANNSSPKEDNGNIDPKTINLGTASPSLDDIQIRR